MFSHATRWMAFSAVVILCTVTVPRQTCADEREELEDRIEILSEEAHELREKGAEEELEEVELELEILGDRLLDGEDEDAEEREQVGEQLEKILAAVEVLRELGHTEDAARVEAIANHLIREQSGMRRVVRRKIIRRKSGGIETHEEHVEENPPLRGEHRERREREEGEVRSERRERETREHAKRDERSRAREEHPEIRAARDQVAFIHLATEVLAGADRKRGADQLRRVAAAIELAIDGKREEARKMRETAPSRGQQAEWLMFASRLLEEKGRQDQAHRVHKLADNFARRDPPRGANEQNHALRRVQEQIQQLSKQLEELQRHVARLQEG